MADQPELDLLLPATSAAPAPVVRAKRGFGGFTRAQLVLGAALVVALIWSMWVTKALVGPREEQYRQGEPLQHRRRICDGTGTRRIATRTGGGRNADLHVVAQARDPAA